MKRIVCFIVNKLDEMPRERIELTRYVKDKKEVSININDIFRNTDIQREVIKHLKQRNNQPPHLK